MSKLWGSLQKELAGKVKNKIKESKEERKRRKEEDKQTKKEERTTNQANDEEVVYADPGPTGGGEIKIDSYEVIERKYISNKQFFFELTDYGDNRGETCTSVAVQLLLTYNNWANDGRLITHPDFLYERTPEILAQPYHFNMISTTSKYDPDDGITTFYEQLIAYIDPMENGTWGLDAYFGIERYLQVYVEETVSDLIDINVCENKQKVCSVITQELEADRPSLVGITSYQLKDDGTLKTGGHSIVVYGSQSFNVEGEELEGFIAHFGWHNTPPALWVNSAWVNDCLTFETTHTHTDAGFSAQNHIVQCTECGRTTHTKRHVYDKYIFIVDGEDFHETRHTGICFCGYEGEISHQFYYEWYDYIQHYKKCKCGYFRLETHWSKYGDYCFECGYELNN